MDLLTLDLQRFNTGFFESSTSSPSVSPSGNLAGDLNKFGMKEEEEQIPSKRISARNLRGRVLFSTSSDDITAKTKRILVGKDQGILRPAGARIALFKSLDAGTYPLALWNVNLDTTNTRVDFELYT